MTLGVDTRYSMFVNAYTFNSETLVFPCLRFQCYTIGGILIPAVTGGSTHIESVFALSKITHQMMNTPRC